MEEKKATGTPNQDVEQNKNSIYVADVTFNELSRLGNSPVSGGNVSTLINFLEQEWCFGNFHRQNNIRIGSLDLVLNDNGNFELRIPLRLGSQEKFDELKSQMKGSYS